MIHYWHGLDLIAQSDGTQTTYFQYDGLGSVRQLTDPAGGVQLAQTFDPYGNPYSEAGSATTTLGFTGEQQDSNGLLFLRARYYSSSMGRFFQIDPSRQEKNAYQYSMGNPIMMSDPLGLTTGEICGGPTGLYCLVAYWKYVYSKNGPSVNCSEHPYSGKAPTNVAELFIDYVCEYGPSNLVLNGDSPLTLELARSTSIAHKRAQLYQGFYSFISGGPEQMGLSGAFDAKIIDAIMNGTTPSPNPLIPFIQNAPLTLNDFLGGYDYWEIRKTDHDTLRFEVRNTTSLVSGTRNPAGSQPGVRDISLEEYLQSPELYQGYNIISILAEKNTRNDSVLTGLGGGTMTQTFKWEERYKPAWTCIASIITGIAGFPLIPIFPNGLPLPDDKIYVTD